jgi:hypothetical protein
MGKLCAESAALVRPQGTLSPSNEGQSRGLDYCLGATQRFRRLGQGARHLTPIE